MNGKVLDFSAAVPSALAIKNGGHLGAVMYISPARESWMKAKPITRSTIDDFDHHGLQSAFVWQFGKEKNPDVMRGFNGGVEDAKAAQKHLDSIRCAGHPVFFAVDFDISLSQWNNTASHYFRGAISVLGKQRVGIYGHSRVVHWAMEDDLVAQVEPGRVLGWVTKSWSKGATGKEYAVLYQGVHNVRGPDGVQVDINEIYHPEWGWRALPTPPRSSFKGIRVDATRWMYKHYTKGRGGRKIKYVTRHHMAGIGDENTCWNWWQSRQASAHFAVKDDHVGQLVPLEDTAWTNTNTIANQESVTIEHSNSGGANEDWPISDKTIRRGAQLAAEICFQEGLGRPEFNKNIKDHRQYYATSCPHHLAFGGKYHDRWMREAQEWYDIISTKGGIFMALNDQEQRELLDSVRWLKRQLQPWEQLGKNEKGETLTLVDAVASLIQKVNFIVRQLQPWKQLGKNNRGEDLTLVDAIAAVRHQVYDVQKKIKGEK